MGARIPRLTRKATPTLLQTDFGNQLIDLVNALADMKVSPSGFGKVTGGPAGMTLDLGPLQKVIEDLLKKLNAIAQTSGTGGEVGALTKRVDLIIQSIANSSLDIVCNGDGTITGTLIFPGLPPQSTA